MTCLAAQFQVQQLIGYFPHASIHNITLLHGKMNCYSRLAIRYLSRPPVMVIDQIQVPTFNCILNRLFGIASALKHTILDGKHPCLINLHILLYAIIPEITLVQ